jgi:hypothetical protein
MRSVLRAVLGRYELQPCGEGREPTVRRAITVSPGAGARVVLRERKGALVAA